MDEANQDDDYIYKKCLINEKDEHRQQQSSIIHHSGFKNWIRDKFRGVSLGYITQPCWFV